MYSFKNDYSEGAHPNIIEALTKTNFIQSVGYGCDEYCELAKTKIKNRLHCENVDIHFLVGGTQANQTVIASALRPHQAVIAAATGHINVHETGAIEATGHKVLTVETKDGKLTPSQIKEICENHPDEHMVQPKMVYVSNTTELGTLYKKEELRALYECCKELSLLFFLDGARLGSALASLENDILLEDLPNLADVFYIGGTKNGALFGEAVVICNDSLKEDFRYHIKQRGGLLAKGRLLGIQFSELFEDDLYLKLGKHANDMAMEIKNNLILKGYQLKTDSYSNQLFVIFTDDKIKELEKNFLFEKQERVDETHTCVRFVTSWATTEEAVKALIAEL